MYSAGSVTVRTELRSDSCVDFEESSATRVDPQSARCETVTAPDVITG